MNNADSVLTAIAAKIREIVRLMSVDNANTEVCLVKLDSCISHLNGIRGVVDAIRIAIVEDNLHALRSELLREDQVTTVSSNNDEVSYCAPRPVSGIFIFVLSTH